MKDALSTDLPPILPDIKTQLRDYLICPGRLPIHDLERNQEFWPRQHDISALYNIQRAPMGTTLMVKRDPNTGKIIEFREVPVLEAGSTARNSMSLNRAPAQCESIRGDAANIPFWPGGIPEPVMNLPEDSSADFTDLFSIPPGFIRGITFENDCCTVFSESSETVEKHETVVTNEDEENIVNLMELIQKEQDLLEGLWNENKNMTKDLKISTEPTIEIDETEILPKETEIPIFKISEVENNKPKRSKWAVIVDIQNPIEDFHERIPDMVRKYPFELDTFQKQAILKLEENCDVFVAAHTSAGKTVVAEYAIALSQKHNTRTIYTSPIKALSNQKYRDFKHIFQDVGLVTGDFQINQTGVCLIMTTEILRSMLYCGSEVIRDLEYVIFDEVHYINDAERGHVWEEVLILLPSHVRIVLLSATVPNSLQFAEWLGCTKQRVVYVITTLQRPVPLQHYLYTGSGGKTKDERFLIIDAKGNFNMENYKTACTVVKQRLDALSKTYVKNKQKQEGSTWSGLIDHLKRNDLLPVIVFTFSRGQCDENARILRSIDLTTEEEKSKIHSFYQHCIRHLKKPDQKLPQILTMEKTLKKGIGVHHSGVLPIVKEIVEMLFQNGLVKILFATETFAMGVNMPARTVIFNGIKKFDGKESRILKPAEYIQMAGRAGRRGLDKTGTVIIRHSDYILDILQLRNMALGKPQNLESQFRLTYGMLLSLLRVESLSIESMMTHSFNEVDHVAVANQLQVELKKSEEELQKLSSKELSVHLQNLTKYYYVASEYITQWNNVQPTILSQQKAATALIPGAVLLISHKWHMKKLAILLNVNTKKEVNYKVLVLKERDEKAVLGDKPEDWYKMLSLTFENFYIKSSSEHEVLEIKPHDIISISSNKFIKLDTDLIIKDWEKRQIPRFRDEPPGHTCQQAIQELAAMSKDGCILEFYDPIKDFRIKDIDLMQQIAFLKNKEVDLLANLINTKIANFESQFAEVYIRKHLEEKVDNLKFKISHRSLTLYPEYLSRIEILKELKYVNDQNRVDLKGRVACGIGMNELLVTELVLRNTLTKLHPAEVAALLSALVFQAKSNVDPELTPTLKQGQEEIEKINRELETLELQHHICSPGKESNLNFKLVEVVYEWAREKPFADIMSLTDVQEGIIVRCIQQLNETLKDVKDAAVIIGDPVLQTKMDEASNAIKRDIVFAASLYIQREAANIGT